MKKRSLLIIIILSGAVLLACLAAFLTTASFDTTLEFSVVDSVSGEWVWDCDIRLQERMIKSHFRTGHRFTHLKPGQWTLNLSAPAYQSVEVPVSLKSGRNIIEEPIAMTGLEIPDLDHFIIMDDVENGELVAEIRPVSSSGPAVVNHPCLDIRVLILISAQMTGDSYSRVKTDSGGSRGEELFRGELEWNWDSEPETVFRYTASVPLGKVKKNEALFWVVDYLVIVPDPVLVSRDDADKLVLDLWELKELDQLASYLDAYGAGIRYFIFPSWNVEGGAL